MRARLTGISTFALGTLLLPVLANAQTASGIFNLINTATRILNALVSLFVLAAVVVFFWGLIQYLMNVGEEKSKGLQTMIWGIIAIFVMVSIWGIIRILQQTIGVNSNTDQSFTPQGIVPRY
ncbi:MAG: hypothetical protein JO019_01650 [Candidatus Kaiserbacteria bacterium]|nr:hypothetical protein [Candidatus Kaiserbacteria bacterium]